MKQPFRGPSFSHNDVASSSFFLVLRRLVLLIFEITIYSAIRGLESSIINFANLVLSIRAECNLTDIGIRHRLFHFIIPGSTRMQHMLLFG